MARFVLQKCKLREHRLVPLKDEPPITLNWRELCKLLAPSRDVRALRVLQQLQTNSFVGLVALPGSKPGTPPGNFVMTNPDLSGDLSRVLGRDASFAARLSVVYRVDDVEWDAKVTEKEGLHQRPREAGF